MRRARRVALCLVTTALVACSSTASEKSESPAVLTTEATGKVHGTVTYAGPKKGAVRLALFRSAPVAGQPHVEPVAWASYPEATFPLAYEIQGPAGEFQLVGYLDLENDQAQPNNNDVVFPSKTVNVVSGGDVTIDFVVTD